MNLTRTALAAVTIGAALALSPVAAPAADAPVAETFKAFTAWQPVNAKWADRLRSEDPDRHWKRCAIRVAGTTTVVCPDGFSWRS